jgi:hypothetical protein
MDLSGTLRVTIRSRPLNNQDLCPPWEINLDNFDDWNADLQRLSNQNLVETGRRGCTTMQFYDWIGRNVNTMVRTDLVSTAFHLASQRFSEHDSVRKVKGFLNEAKTSVWSYAVQARAIVARIYRIMSWSDSKPWGYKRRCMKLCQS